MDSQYIERMFGVRGRVIVLTGAGGVLCGMMARELAKAGARVAVLDILPEAARKVADEITAAGGEAIAVAVDVLDRASITAGAEAVMARWGRVDGLINGAGGNRKQASTSPELSFFDLPQEAFQWVFDLNFIGTLLPSQVFGKIMAAQGAGSIINIASVNSYRPLTNIPAYSAAKAAVRNFTEWLAVHMSQNYGSGVRVNAIAPGFYMTTQLRFLHTDAKTGQPTPRARATIGHTPMGRYGEPVELMSTVIFLLAPGSAFVHGVTVPIDGGFCAYSGV
jgi:NAD(P)-dependent dehydrogenase (short-subunit alcohol dehydrogenase family)